MPRPCFRRKLADAEKIQSAGFGDAPDKAMREQYAAYLAGLWKSSMKAMDYESFKQSMEKANG
jgi:hypothetical protein